MAEYLEIAWEDEQWFEAVKGHILKSEMIEICQQQGREIPDNWNIRHCFARWIPTKYGPFDMTIHFEKESKRGNWPVTVAEE